MGYSNTPTDFSYQVQQRCVMAQYLVAFFTRRKITMLNWIFKLPQVSGFPMSYRTTVRYWFFLFFNRSFIRFNKERYLRIFSINFISLN